MSCKNCGLPVFWVTMQSSGKHNLLDAERSPVGDIVVADMNAKPRLARTVPPREWSDNPERYTSHYLTCPKSPIAEEMRRRGRGWMAR